MYKCHFEKSNIELLKANLSAISRICKLPVQISSIDMCIVPRPAHRMQFQTHIRFAGFRVHGDMLRNTVGIASGYNMNSVL
jgi:hypothetical protein